jgi:hypothetical protein
MVATEPVASLPVMRDKEPPFANAQPNQEGVADRHARHRFLCGDEATAVVSKK